MNLSSPLPRSRKETPLNGEDVLKRLWLLRILVPLEGHKTFLREKDFLDDRIARAVGLEHYLAGDENHRDYDRRDALSELHLKWRDAEQRGVDIPEDTVFAMNLSRMRVALGLTEAETRIVQFAAMVRTDGILGIATDCIDALSLPMLERLLATCLDLSLEAVKLAISDDRTLFRTGILWVDLNANYGFMNKVVLLNNLADELHRNHNDPLELFLANIVPSERPKLTQVDYPHLAKDIRIIKGYLGHPECEKHPGTNILLHGVPGSGKTEFVRMLAQCMGYHLYEVATENRHGSPLGGDNRFRAYRLAQSLLERRSDTLIMFDEIEDVFQGTGGNLLVKGNQSGKKAWVNRLLEENQVPAFWLTNNLYSIDPAVLRRFDYVIEMKAPPRSVRACILDNYLAELPVSDAWKREMAAHEDLVPAVVERAAKVVRSIKGDLQQHEAEIALERVMGNTLDALGLPRKSKSGPNIDMTYRLDILNADCDVKEVCTGLQRVRSGRLCLYGPPGTGKTAFGSYVAEMLDCPLQVKRASDILSPYVGVAEKNMARMFRDAEEEGAVLLLDEADTYLQDRNGAQHSWEISQVNEMLTQMESFDGIFIASTNLMGSLDAAALRRFDLKMRFDYLKPDQAWAMFCDTARLLDFEVDVALKPDVARVGLLTPGDFALVARQTRLRKVRDGVDFLSRLAAECAVKLGGQKRSIGF